jgi:ubiquinone biosynthesis protein
MDLIRTGIGLTKTIRNVSRLREIVLVFAKNGFDEFISLNVISSIPNFVLPRSKKGIKEQLDTETEKDWPRILGHRLRLCFEELGPAFIKFGQLLSSREDIFDSSFIEEMKILRDKVKPVPFDQVKSKIEESLGGPIDSVFKEIDPNPIGTASIGVVYQGTLLDGTEVVLKVKRPGIEKMMETDFSILRFLASQAEKVSEEVKYLGVSRVVKDFSLSLTNELNFHTEALNCSRFKKVLENHDKDGLLCLPQIYEEFSSRDLLVMEKLKGIPFSDYQRIMPHIEELAPKLDEGLKIFIKTFLSDGFFHADLHGGNFFWLENGKIGLIDFGLMGTLSKKGRKNFIAIVYSLINFNYENVVYEFLEVATYDKIPDIDGLIEDVRDALSPYIGLTVQQTDFSEVLKAVISTLKRHEIYLPREWFIVFRALMTLDGVGRSLDQDYDIYAMMEDDIHEIIRESFTKEELIEEGLWAAKDLISIARIVPRHLKWFLRDFSNKKYGVELILTGYEDSARMINSSLVFVAYTLLTCLFVGSGVYFIGSVRDISHWTMIPTITWIFWILGAGSFFKGYFTLNKTK